MIYLRLFFAFFKIGLFSVGGGLATIPFLQELSARTGWFTVAELTNMLAVAESTPGPIGINTATYVGYTTAGLIGGVIATLGILAPALIVGAVIATMMSRFRESEKVKMVFSGLRPASVAMIAAAGAGVAALVFLRTDAYRETGSLLSLLDWKAVVLALAVFALTRVKKLSKVHPALFIVIGAAVGIVFHFAG